MFSVRGHVVNPVDDVKRRLKCARNPWRSPYVRVVVDTMQREELWHYGIKTDNNFPCATFLCSFVTFETI